MIGPVVMREDRPARVPGLVLIRAELGERYAELHVAELMLASAHGDVARRHAWIYLTETLRESYREG